jgi:hypothetical protein
MGTDNHADQRHTYRCSWGRITGATTGVSPSEYGDEVTSSGCRRGAVLDEVVRDRVAKPVGERFN